MATAYLLWKVFKKTKYIPLKDIPIEEVLERIALRPEPEEPRKTGWYRWISLLWD